MPHVEEVEVRGHIIDSLILPKILDVITAGGGAFQIKRITIGQSRADASYALLEVRAETAELLAEILAQIADHGAVPTALHDARLEPADIPGAFPEGFYSTTNQRTEVRLEGHWMPVADQEMDCGIQVDSDEPQRPLCADDRRPARRSNRRRPCRRAGVSRRAKTGAAIVRVHEQCRLDRKAQGGGHPANRHGNVPHPGEPGKIAVGRRPGHRSHRQRAVHGQLIRRGYLHRLFAGNALATHDIEQTLFGTSLGVHLERGDLAEAGHEHHLRAINRIRRCGGIRQAVEKGVLTSGIMYECVKHNVDFLLAGSIRDDGPLPEVITDSLEAQRQMREKIRDITFCLMIATTLHSVAVGNLLPAWVKVVCVDINPSTVIKLNDRGSFQTVGLVTDVEPFLRALVEELQTLEKTA